MIFPAQARFSTARWAFLAILLSGCAGPLEPADAGGGDGRVTTTACDHSRPALPTNLAGASHVVIARDGTGYVVRSQHLARWRGGDAEADWIELSPSYRTFALALNAANDTLYVSVERRGILRIDVLAATPALTVVTTEEAGAMTMGMDGYLYWAHLRLGTLNRLDPATELSTQVSTTEIWNARALAFESPTSLLVGAGNLYRMTLADGHEVARDVLTGSVGQPQGIAVAADGSFFVTGASSEIFAHLVDGDIVSTQRIDSPGGLDFGAGPLHCDDVYVSGLGGLVRLEDIGPGAPVPWH